MRGGREGSALQNPSSDARLSRKDNLGEKGKRKLPDWKKPMKDLENIALLSALGRRHRGKKDI